MNSAEKHDVLSGHRSKGLAVVTGSAGTKVKESLADDLNLATLKALTAQVIQGFDYDYIRAQFSEEEWLIGSMRKLVLILGEVIRIEQALRLYPEQCIPIGDELIGKLLSYRETLVSGNVLRTHSVESISANDEAASVVTNAIARIQRDLAKAVELAHSYRSNPTAVVVRAEELMDLVNDVGSLLTEKSEKKIGKSSGIGLNGNLADALACGLDASYARLPEHDFALVVQPGLDLVDRESRSINWEDTTASLDSQSLQFLQQEVNRLCPPAFRKIVARVIFMKLASDAPNNGWHKAGNYLLDEDTGYASIRINLVPFKDNLTGMLSVILHEIAHAGHDSFPVAMLKLWEDEIATEIDWDVTPYIAKVRGQNKEKLRAEDFADTFQLFCLDPDKLRALSARRYSAMQKICAIYSPS